MSFIAPGDQTKVSLVATSLIKTKFHCQSGPGSDLGHGTDRGGLVVCLVINSLVIPDTGWQDCTAL